jgi:polyhydroxyalkanoate synthesis regulator phasin
MEETSAKTENTTTSSAAQSIRDLIEKTFLAGMGAAALTKDRIQDLVDGFVSRGQINMEEGREVAERLLERSREEARLLLRKADSSLQGAYRELGLTPKQELEQLILRVEQLEHRVGLLEGGSDSGGSEAEAGKGRS